MFSFDLLLWIESNEKMIERTKVNVKGRQLVCVIALLFGVLVGQCSFGQDKKPDNKGKKSDKKSADSKLLSEYGIEATEAGIKEYLVSLVPVDDDQIQKANQLIGKLSAPDYLVRERATKKLIALSGISTQTLKPLGDNLSSPEAKFRFRGILAARSDKSRSQAQYILLSQIKAEKFPWMAALVVNAFPYLEPDGFVRRASSAAIEASATAEDIELLRRALNDAENPSVLRAGCLAGISRVKPDEALASANRLVGQSGALGIEVAKILVQNKQPHSVDALLSLLEDEDAKTKFLAFNVIRGITGLRFEGNYLSDAKSVAEATAKTKTWMLENADKEIDFNWPKSFRLGRRLVCRYDSGKVVELDESNKVVWSIEANNPFCCLGLPNGHRLVVLYVNKKMIEYDASGQEVKKIDLPTTTSGFCRLPSGEFWVAGGQGGNKIAKLSEEGKKVKEFDVKGTPTSIEVGNNGNLVCALYGNGKIVELDGEGKVVKSITVKGKPYHAQPLASGNYLVAFPVDGRIVEYAPDGKLVWEYDCEKNSYRAQELEDGSIVFSDINGFHRVSRAGNTIETKSWPSGSINYSFSY